ncbi:MAG: hypothetical protein K2M00_07045 [Muribaculaceae bacterium]|nr:hypothetical protein [Muribaculaceae bacterium]
MKILCALTGLIMIALVSSCGQKSEAAKQLEAAEKVLAINADSAKILVSETDSVDLNKESERMLKAYLKNLVALELNDYDNFNDSTVSEVYDYAKGQRDKHFKAKASFLKGVSCFKSRDMKPALEYEFDALNYLEGINDPYLEGLINAMLAIIYHDTFKPGPGIKYAERAAECFNEAGNSHDNLFSRLIIVKLEHAVNNHDRVIELAPEIAEDAKRNGEMSIRFETLGTLANSYVYKEQYDNAIETYRTLEEEGLMIPFFEGEYIYALALNGNLDIAGERLKRTDEMPPFAQLVKARECYYRNVGDTINAYKQLSILMDWQSRTVVGTMDDGIIDTVEEAYRKDKALKAEQIRSANIIKWVVIISAVIILLTLTVAGIWYHRRRIRLKNMELDLQMSKILELTESVEDSRLQNEQLNDEIGQLFRKQWSTLNMLCNDYFEKGDNTALKATILTEVEKEINRMSGREGLKSIEEALDHHFDGLVTRLKEQLPDFDKRDIAFLVFSYAGFSPRAICLFTGFTIKYYYKKRAVLKEKILATDAPDRQLFVDLLG